MFFGRSVIARRVSEPWFDGLLLREEAYLLLAMSAHEAGNYIAITSRQVASLSDQLATSAWASVVVHRLLKPGPGFKSDPEAVPAIGMAAVEVL